MKSCDWGFISPEEVSEIISFERKNSQTQISWKYHSGNGEKTMFDIQAEGTASIWNLLDLERLALLTDEVGMGKTIQALSVCALLWRLRPDAGILVFAPNHSIAENWVNEYKTFINSHYRKCDNLVRTEIGNKAVHEPFLCGNLASLEEIIQSKWCHFIIAKTSSLSYYHCSRYESWDIRMQNAFNNGQKLNSMIIAEMGKQFDLMIIDEAHYYRNFYGPSLRVSTAKGLFGRLQSTVADTQSALKNPLAERVLLLTATPNHTSNEDIRNIVRYFNLDLSREISVDILSRIAVRRFRRLGKKIKYNYRNEIAKSYDFKDDVLGELFYALYQRKLALEMDKTNTEKKSFTYGYLEGFESTNFEKLQLGVDDKKLENIQKSDETEPENSREDSNAEDFNITVDSKIFRQLVKDFQNVFKDEEITYPVHPKYSGITDDVTP